MGLLDNNTSGNMRKGGGLRHIYQLAKPAMQLSADQEGKINAILNQLKEERQSIKNSGSTNMDGLRTARQQAKQQLMQVLNPEQQKIWQDNINAWKQRAN